MILALGVAVAGGVGAACRFVLDGAIRARTTTTFPVGTLLINVTGSLLLGLVVGLASAGMLPAPLAEVLGVGFLGGYTTFSTAAVESVRLIQERRPWPAVASSAGMLVAGVALAAIGLAIGAAIGTAAR